jgi:DNA-binding GntR family transcriptional regulator
MSIDRALPIPAYYQIALDLRRRIAAGEWAETTRLPAELKLAEHYRVSRSTLRQALLELEGDGIVVRHRPAGTFINRERLQPVPKISIPVSFVQTYRALGYAPRVEVRVSEVQKGTSDDIARALGIDAYEQVAYFERLFSLDGQVIDIIRSVLPLWLCPGITEQPLIDGSIHSTLAKNYGLELTQADHDIEAVRATREDEADLGVDGGSPLLVLTSVYCDADNRPVEHVRIRWIGEAARLHLSTRSGPSVGVSSNGGGELPSEPR